jgi:hypothetical protein
MYDRLDVARAQQQLAMDRACRNRLIRRAGGGAGGRLQRLLPWRGGTDDDGRSAEVRHVAASGGRRPRSARPAA